MTTKLADEYAYIRERMEKLEAETKGRVAGDSELPVGSCETVTLTIDELPELSYDSIYLHG